MKTKKHREKELNTLGPLTLENQYEGEFPGLLSIAHMSQKRHCRRVQPAVLTATGKSP